MCYFLQYFNIKIPEHGTQLLWSNYILVVKMSTYHFVSMHVIISMINYLILARVLTHVQTSQHFSKRKILILALRMCNDFSTSFAFIERKKSLLPKTKTTLLKISAKVVLTQIRIQCCRSPQWPKNKIQNIGKLKVYVRH